MNPFRDRIFTAVFAGSAIASTIAVSIIGWVAIHNIEEAGVKQQIDVHAAVVQIYIALVAICGIALVFCYIVALFAAGRFRRDADPILRAAQTMAAGDAHARIDVSRDDEFGKMAEWMNALADRRASLLREAESQQNEVRTILDHASEGIIVIGESGRILLMNGAARLMFHAPPDATGRLFVEVSRNAKIQEFVERVRDSFESLQADIVIDEEDLTTFRFRGSRIPDPGGREVRILLIAGDISDLRRLERMRIDFVANASHEIKTPLSAILGYAETLQDDPDLDAETRGKFLETIARNSRRLEELVRDMLHLARLDSAGGAFQFDSVSVVEVCESAFEAHREPAKKKGIDLSMSETLGDLKIIAERELLYQSISNLISNAIKYTPSGGKVTLEASAGAAGVQIIVKDTGTGIAPEHLARIFERFYRADPARSREAGGTGLGLAIVKHAVLLHGGKIDVESEPGVGSRFRVSIPFEPPK
ncbi:MAG: PAS domain-containing protein [Planctomycetes bacterium]|nr:PAS domain-containing protein [Planctomycetota bacterium]